MKKIVVLILVALIATLGIWYITKDKAEDVPMVTEEEPVVVDVDDKKTIIITAVETSDYGVSENSVFNMSFSEPVTEEAIKKNLTIEPMTAFEIDRISDEEYVIKPIKALQKNQIYVFNYDEFDYGKAFQVIDDLKIYDAYPGDKANDVPVRTAIELYFNSTSVNDIEDFFEITPAVEGQFEYDGEKVIFLTDEFNSFVTYEVIVKAGLSDGERTLDEDYAYSFTTGYGDGFSSQVYYTIFNTLPGEESIFKVHDWMNGYKFNVSIYEMPSFDVFKETFELFNESQKSLDLSSNTLVYEEELTPLTYNYRNYLTLPSLNTGRYVVVVKDKDAEQYVFMQVDPHQVYYTKATNGELFWVIDNEKNIPTEGAVILNDDTEVGKTDAEGLAFIDVSNEGQYQIDIEEKSYLVKTKQSNIYYDMYGYYPRSSMEHWSFMYTDRNAYQMTDEINVFGFVRSFTDEPINEVKLILSPYWDEEIITETVVSLDEEQSYTGKLNITDLDKGYYQLKMMHGDTMIAYKEVIVEDFEKPEVYLKSNVDKTILFAGETINYSVQAKYFNELPYEGLGLNFYYSDSQKSTDRYNTDADGMINFELEVDMAKTDWKPGRYNISAENYSATDTYLYNTARFDVLPRTIMIQTETTSDEKTATVDLATNLIDLSNFNGNYGKNYENIKGDSVDVSYEVIIKDNYTVKTFVETVYDPIHKLSYDKYNYDRKTSYLDNIIGETLNGLGSFTFPMEEDHSYEVEIRTHDTNGKITTTRTYFNQNRNYYYNNDRLYSYSIFEDNYDVGDRVTFEVLKSGESIEKSQRDFAVHMILRDGILSYEFTDDPTYAFDFVKDYRPNVFVKTLYYDGNTVNVLPEYGSQLLRYDYETLAYDLTYEVDKESYGPSDHMTLDLNISQDKEPFNGVVNISVVDEAFLSLYEDYFDIGNDLHQLVYSDGILVETYSGTAADEASMAEMGEGGDGDYIRDDFKDTAYFGTVKVVDGKASVEVKLPDNLTSWRLTLHAVNKELEYANIRGNVNVSLPYFVRTLYNKKYLTGDDVYLTLNSDGEMLEDDQIAYKAKLLKNEVVLTESTLNTQGKGNVSLPVGVLEKGDYSVIVEGETADYIDGVKEDIEVKDTYVNFTHVKEGPLTTTYELKYPDRETELIVYNQGALDYMGKIHDVRSYSRYRIEEILGGFEADRLLSSYFENYSDEFDVKEYQNHDGGIKMLRTDDSSVEATALILGTDIGVDQFDENAMKRYLTNALKDENLSYSKKAMILWGLASQGDPVLLGIDKFMESHDLKGAEKLYIALALLELGDKTRAVELGNSMFDDQIYSDLSDKEKLLAGSLARKINLEDNRFDAKFTIDFKSKDAVALEKLYYISLLPVEFDEASLTYELNGTDHVVELPDLNAHKINLKSADTIAFKNVSNDLYVTERFEVTGLDYKDHSSTLYKVKRTMAEQVEVGEIVEVIYDYEKPFRGGGVIRDVIPAGFEYAGEKDKKSHNVRNTNQEIEMYVYDDSTTGTISYYIRAIQVGTYHVESTHIQSYDRRELDMTDPTVIEVAND
ncbi:MAG: hypothetical protein JEZ08_05505 [Clostridiales bacterium]|nr:hypothetical protein [Clostridiales bacterium]